MESLNSKYDNLKFCIPDKDLLSIFRHGHYTFLNSLVVNSLIPEVALVTGYLAKAAIPLHL